MERSNPTSLVTTWLMENCIRTTRPLLHVKDFISACYVDELIGIQNARPCPDIFVAFSLDIFVAFSLDNFVALSLDIFVALSLNIFVALSILI